LIALFAVSAASAHEVRPALLQITRQSAHRYDVLWKQPVNGDVALHLVPHLSSGALDRAPDVSTLTPSYALKLWRSVSDAQTPLDRQTVSVLGLERSITDVLVNVTLADGRNVQQFLTPKRSTSRLDLSERVAPPAAAYLTLGIEHILTGIDHLLFVFGLLLLVRKPAPVLRTITAFTVAHSVTLAATTLGWIHVRSSVVEALVALSIVILAVELVRHARGEAGFTSRYPWLIAFAFGLLHGCAFAGALAEVGLPAHDIPLALLLFNVGVEIGQLLFIAAASLALWGVLRIIKEWPTWAYALTPYVIGTFASYWFIERLLIAVSAGVSHA
jgi:hydrogenase/urease accessory protein HupE